MKKLSIRDTLQPIFGLTFAIRKISDEILHEEMNITLSQFRMLIATAECGEACQRTVADLCGITEASASRQIDILVKAKLLVKVKNPASKREFVLKLTPGGERTIEKAMRIMDKRFEELFGTVSQSERKKFADTIELFLNQIKNQTDVCDSESVKPAIKTSKK
jgi:DNA-binding MarR family transcriptional regulator